MTRLASTAPQPLVASANRGVVPELAEVLMPVWGQPYVHQFLQFGLPTLLSPGNLPYVAAKLPCKLVILTSSEDCLAIANSPLMARVQAIGCEVQVRPIDHLITHTNQSTTITLAFTEAVLSSGEAMLKTCFFFAMSDYIYAAGSLKSVIDRMLSGRSAVVVGNFQVVRETALPSLTRIMEWSGQAPALQPRELMAWALLHLHPATVANTVNVPFNHNAHTNRLFWRVDESTLLGRFYLRHPICVRPETTEFLIGSSLDYSFLPEMCPSGNVTSITDSDEYMVIEMQPADHEASMLRFGPLREKELAKSLAGWATKEHRQNVGDIHVYHAKEFTAGVPAVRHASDAFISEVARQLKGRPRPHRGHRYWKGAIVAFSAARSPQDRTRPLAHVYGPEHMSWLSRWWWRRQQLLFGQPPSVRPWDSAWPDYRAVGAELSDAIDTVGDRLLIVTERPSVLSIATPTNARVQRARTESLVRNPPMSPQTLGAPFDTCLLELSDSELKSASVLLRRLRQCLVPGGRILLMANLNHRSATRLAALSSPGITLLRRRLVARTVPRQAAYRASRFLHHFLAEQPWFGVPLVFLLGPPVLCASVMGNLLAGRVSRPTRKVHGYSTLIMVLETRPDNDASSTGPLDSRDASPVTSERALERHLAATSQ